MTAAHRSMQVAELLRHVDDARQARQRECVRLLSELTPQLQKAVAAERQRELHRAPQFNVFKYLREDELGLSRIIADLLNPTAAHGQGTSFLEEMLDALPETRGRFGTLRPTTPIRVATERWTTTDGRIDITVDIPSAAGRFCLAFENKPYAHDQGGQLKAYLEYLGEKYGTCFLLVYLPPVHREPDEARLPQVDRERWHGHFRRYDDVPPNNDGRTRIKLHSGGPGPNRWYWGVQSPKRKSKMTEAERERREELCTALGHHGLSLAHGDGDWWTQWEWLPRYKDWDPLVPDLHDECEAGGGPITDCYVDGLLEIAALAIPAINEVETAGRATPSE